MRLKKVRNARRRLSFYRATYGIIAPFSVLVDGTAVQTSINLKVKLEDEVPKVLGGRAQLLVPTAVISELKGLGKEYADAEKIARQLEPLVTEETNKPQTAAEALLSLVAGGNAQHYCVLTEDPTLQRRLAKMPGVPLLRFARERIIVEAPAERTADQENAARSRPSPTAIPGAAPAPASERPTLNKSRKSKQKQPNPLSVKKKIKKTTLRPGRVQIWQGRDASNGAGEKEDGGGRKRKRKRPKATEPES